MTGPDRDEHPGSDDARTDDQVSRAPAAFCQLCGARDGECGCRMGGTSADPSTTGAPADDTANRAGRRPDGVVYCGHPSTTGVCARAVPELWCQLHGQRQAPADDTAACPPLDGGPRWRTGRRIGRTLYQQTGDHPADDDPLIGVLDTTELAARAVAAVNRPLPGSTAGTYDRIVAEVQRSWPTWSALHGLTGVDRAIEHAVHITLSMIQQEAERP